MKVRWLVLLLSATVASHSHGQTCGQWLAGSPMPGVTEGGTVRTSIAWDPDGTGPLGTHLVVGGEFTVIGNAVASNIAMWNPATDQWSALGSGTNDDVLALAVMPDNTLIAGGRFTACGVITTRRIARWDGTVWSPLADSVVGEGVSRVGIGDSDSYVAALLRMNDGRLLVGGNFEFAGTEVHRRMVIWSGTAWNRALSGQGGVAMFGSSYVASLAALPDGSIVVGGSFNSLSTLVSASNIGGLTSDAQAGFALGDGLNGPVFAVAVRNNGNIIAGGQFTASGATPMAHLARWSGSAWVAMGSGTDGNVHSIHVNPSNGNEIYIGGSFSVAGSVACRSIARTNGTGGSYTDLGGGLHTDLYTLSLPPRVYTIFQFAPGVLFAGGVFSSSNQSQLRGIAKWNGATWSPIAAGLSAPVRAIDVDSSGGVLVGGYFTNTPSGTAKRVATWSPSGFAAVGQGTDDAVFAVKRLHNNDVVVAGNFDDAGGTFASSVARYNGSTWGPVGPGFPVAPNYPFKSIAQLPVGAPNLGAGDLYVGGEIGGVLPVAVPYALNVASFNGTSWFSLDGSWGSFLDSVGDGFVAAVLSLPDGNLVLAGNFDNVSGSPVSACVARWKPGTYLFENIGTAFNSAVHKVYALARMPNGDIIAGGDFSVANGGPGNAIARWNGTAWVPLGSGLTGTVYALTVAANGDLIAGGALTSAGGNPVNNIARWNGTTWSAMGDGVRNTVYALATRSNGEILVGGSFARAGGNVSAYFARWSDAALPQIVQQPLSETVPCFVSPEFTVTVDPGTTPTYQWYYNGSPISNGGKYEITTLPSGSRLRFNILYFYDTDAGDYHVVATTPCGSTTSATATLTITGDCPPPCPADLNGDTVVDDADFVLFAAAYNELICNPPEEEPCAGDLNTDDFVDDADFVLFAEAYNELLCP